MNWQALYHAKQAEIRQLARLVPSEVSPSIRSFAQYVTTHKQEPAVIAALKRADPERKSAWTEYDVVALAQECDEAEVGAIAVYTEPSVFGMSLGDMRTIAAAVSAPVLRLDLILHANQILHSRLYGADAVLLVAAALDLPTLTRFITVAGSAHIAAVVAVQTRSELEQALAAGALLLGISSPSGTLDVAQLSELAPLAPPQKTLIALDPIRSVNDYTALQGRVDAALVSEALLEAVDVRAALADLTGR